MEGKLLGSVLALALGDGSGFFLSHFHEQGRSKASPAGLFEVISGGCAGGDNGGRAPA